MQKLLQLLGFYGDDYDNEDDYSDHEDDRSRSKKKSGKKGDSRGLTAPPKLVFFKGIPSEDMKLKLRDALLDGAMILLDLGGVGSDRKEEALNLVNFMGGVAFAHKGFMEQLGKSPFFIITPREGMFQEWSGEGEE